MREERFAGASSAAYPGISGGASRGRAIRGSVFFGGEGSGERGKKSDALSGRGRRVAWSCRA